MQSYAVKYFLINTLFSKSLDSRLNLAILTADLIRFSMKIFADWKFLLPS